MEKTDLAYTAGFFDGEGSVGVYHYDAFRARLSISNTYLPILQQLQEKWGGSISTRKGHAGHKQCYCWHLNGRQMVPFLRAMLPYLREKRRQAELCLEFYEKTDRSMKVRRQEIVDQLKELKHAPQDTGGLHRAAQA